MYNLNGTAKRHLACCPPYLRISNEIFLSHLARGPENRNTSQSPSQVSQRANLRRTSHHIRCRTHQYAYRRLNQTALISQPARTQCLKNGDNHPNSGITKSGIGRRHFSTHLAQQFNARGGSLPSAQSLEGCVYGIAEGISGNSQFRSGAEDEDNHRDDPTISSSLSCEESSDIVSDEDEVFTSSFFQEPVEHGSSKDMSNSQPFEDIVPSRSKVDLSYQNLRRREAAASTDGLFISSPISATVYRDNSGFRQIVGQYTKTIDPLIQTRSLSEAQNAKLFRHLSEIFSPQSIQALERRGFSVEDVVTWSWILGPDNAEVGIDRFVLLTKHDEASQRPQIPLFIPLQLLRSAYISATGLDALISAIEDGVKGTNNWDSDSAAVLLIRLLRHARVVGVRFYERIVDLASEVLPVTAKTNTYQDAQRLTHFYNRFLSLIALPLSRHPFLSVDAQQRAQLKIARMVMGSPLRLSLNREGYRALARVQLMHKKTVNEQLWSGVKAPSWPPWRRDELGIDARIEYAGQKSRVSKVIKRLLEAGYGPESMEHEAAILAGWDIDKSPTIQVRRITRRRPLAWLKDVIQRDPSQAPGIDHDVWAARVAATRSVREAWVCFDSYTQATMNQKRQLKVYHEMFYKLFARVQHTDQTQSPSPGDGKEVFPNPSSLRDHVYVPKEPPSINELYGQMVQDGLRPTGRLLAGLMDSANSLEMGLDYVRESAIGEVKKDILLHAEKYPEFVIRKILSTLPDYLLASYLAIFTKRSVSNDIELYWPGSRSVEERGIVPLARVKPLHYCMSLLQIWQPTYMPAYHAMLEGICIQAKLRQSTNGTRRARDHSYTELWKMGKHVLELLRGRGLGVDLICFRKILILIRNSMIRAPSRFHHNNEDFADAVSTIKLVFAQAIHGNSRIKSFSLPGTSLEIGHQPYWKDLEALIIVLGFGRDFGSVIHAVEWMNEQQSQLHCIDAGGYKMQRLVCATRVALESLWSKNRGSSASKEQVTHAQQQVQQWGWPADVDVEEYLLHHESWFEGMRAAARD